MDWGSLCEQHSEDIDTICVIENNNFCVTNTVPVKSIHCFPKNKPWVTKDIKALLNKKKEAFRSGDMEAAKDVQKHLSVYIY